MTPEFGILYLNLTSDQRSGTGPGPGTGPGTGPGDEPGDEPGEQPEKILDLDLTRTWIKESSWICVIYKPAL